MREWKRLKRRSMITKVNRTKIEVVSATYFFIFKNVTSHSDPYYF